MLKHQSSLKIPVLFTVFVYAFWLIWQGPQSAVSNFISQIQIAITMMFGSFVAGGTALGGGAVAFPVMTKVLHIEPATAKVFSLAIQSFGMTAATLTIIFSGIKYYKNVVWLALIGSLPGVLISLMFIADLVPRLATKSIFSLFLALFALTLLKLHISKREEDPMHYWHHPWLICVIGFIGGLVSGLIGSGADIAIFALLMLFYKRGLKASTATSVVIMAVTSVFASCINYFVLGTVSNEISQFVLAAIPVVVVGAPLGAYVCAKMPTQAVLAFLMSLIALEVGFTLYELSQLHLI